MHIPCSPVLSPRWILAPAAARGLPFPLCAERRLSFYVARGGIYNLVRALAGARDGFVLMPDYHSGAEVWAVRAAGARVLYYHVGRNLQLDLEELKTLCARRPLAVYLIHYLGWPQPVREVKDLCRERAIPLIEDCALSLLSESGGQALGTFGDFAVFCLYKTLPVPNGGLLILNGDDPRALLELRLRRCDPTSLGARLSELTLLWLRGRCARLGEPLMRAKNGVGRILTRLGVDRLPVGDISPEFSTPGYDPGKLDIGMSAFCTALLARFDYREIVRRRRENFLRLAGRLAGRVSLPLPDLPDGVCPLFFPILVADKAATAAALRARGIEAVEFWNYGFSQEPGEAGPNAAYLRNHLLELPIHQDVRAEQVDFMADEVLRLERRA